MPLTIHPRAGQIIYADFSIGFAEPEMVKSKRPVVVISPSMQGRDQLVTVVALSTVEPPKLMPYHMKLPRACLPQLGQFEGRDSWVKGDMVYALGWHRLDLLQLGKRDQRTGKRLYFTNVLSRERMREIYACVLAGMGLGHLAKCLDEDRQTKGPHLEGA
jgi:mRNA interferase MazF